jgi:thioredoxin-related protein
MKKNSIKNSAKKIFAILAAAVCIVFSSCKKPLWTTDYDEAKILAAKQKKDILLLFSGDDWTENSMPFRENVLQADSFQKEFKKSYIFLNVDFSQLEFAKTELDENSTEAEKAEAKKIEEEYRRKELLARYYNVQSWPAVYLVSAEGYVLSAVEIDAEKIAEISAEEFSAQVKKSAEDSAELKKQISLLKKSSGVEKAKTIHAVLQNSSQSFSFLLKDLVYEFPSLDPENSLGILGDYELQTAYFKSVENFENGSDPAEPFLNAADSANLSAEQKQEALYMAAYSLANSAEPDFARIKSLLNQSYELDTTSSFAGEIRGAIDNISRYEELLKSHNSD